MDLRSVEVLPAPERIAGVLVLAPAELIATKVRAYHQWRGQPKSGTDWHDLALMFLTFPAPLSCTVPSKVSTLIASPLTCGSWSALRVTEAAPTASESTRA
ncbi:MAG: nucleotidyl transferase AbiEii/AbiGii toxin family protein [Gammaproteobacteria bacterium]